MLQDAFSEVTKIYPPLKLLRVFLNDTTAFLMGKNEEKAEMAKKVMKSLREKVEKKWFKHCRSLRMERKERVR